MESHDTIEARLKSFLGQLEAEYAILDRIVYKNKNQHRRSSYFQYLLKVRSDLRLLQSAHLDEIVNSSFIVINGNRAKQKMQLLESLKRKKGDGRKHNFLEKLKGSTHLLAQMSEPMLKAATEISIMLARSFFVAFSVTVLALLSRLRILVQQILVDVVSVYNTVSTLSQKAQSVKLSQEGFEVFREYYPIHDQSVRLECVWEKDKFVLHETVNEPDSEMNTREDVSVGGSAVQYQSIETVLGDDELVKVNLSKDSEEHPGAINEGTPSATTSIGNNTSLLETRVTEIDNNKQPDEENNIIGSAVGSHSSLSLPLKRKSGIEGKVAFVSVKIPAPSAVKERKTEFSVNSLFTGGSGQP